MCVWVRVAMGDSEWPLGTGTGAWSASALCDLGRKTPLLCLSASLVNPGRAVHFLKVVFCPL